MKSTLDLFPTAAEVQSARQIDPHAAARVEGDWSNLGGGGCTRTREVKPGVLAHLFALTKVNSHTENLSAACTVQP